MNYIHKYMSQQKMLQIHKQIAELAQKQDNCNSCLGLMLSSAESFSNRFGTNKNQKMFEAYNLFNSGDLKNENDLKSQLTLHIKIFRNLVIHEKQKGRKYTFPENLGPQEINNLVLKWRNNVKKEDQIYYDNILKILEENFNINFPNFSKKSYENKSHQGIDPKHIVNIVPNVMGCIDHRANQIGLEAINTGVIKNQIMIGSTGSFNKQLNELKFSDINKGLNQEELEKKNLMDALNITFTYAECYYYLYCKKIKKNPNFHPRYGDINEYLNCKFEDIEKKVFDDLNNLKKIFSNYFGIDNSNLNEYFNSVSQWYSDTKANYFSNLKDVLDNFYNNL